MKILNLSNTKPITTNSNLICLAKIKIKANLRHYLSFQSLHFCWNLVYAYAFF